MSPTFDADAEPTCCRSARDVLEGGSDRLDRRVDGILEVEALDSAPVDGRGLALIESETEAEVVDKALDRLAAIADLAYDLGAPAMERAVRALGVEEAPNRGDLLRARRLEQTSRASAMALFLLVSSKVARERR